MKKKGNSDAWIDICSRSKDKMKGLHNKKIQDVQDFGEDLRISDFRGYHT
jgi:hypothetical protein